MKMFTSCLGFTAIVLLNLVFAERGAAFYDPAVQRWINRDPFSDGSAGMNQPVVRASTEGNLYAFVEHDPSSFYDPWGLWTASGQNDGQSDTIECDGKGGI